MGRKPKELPHLRIRMEPALLARLEKARQTNGRTLTGEIVHRVEQSFQKEDQTALIQATATAAVTAAVNEFKIVNVGAGARNKKAGDQ